MNRSILVVAVLASRLQVSGGNNVTICVVVESGFTMLRDETASPDKVRGDLELKGLDVETRVLSLRGFDYTVRVLPSYGEVEVRTRSGECDVGWAHFFQLSSRISCAPNTETCRDLDAATAAGTVESWEPYRCCARYGPNLFPFDVVAMSHAHDGGGGGFFVSFLAMIRSAFFVNLICFTFLVGAIFSNPNPDSNPNSDPVTYPYGSLTPTLRL